ncbi:MAG: DMT family transporter [Termitinemataceae bacterium]|nr:MAG: DMT family transporter [Termitinemataceae bacterium]
MIDKKILRSDALMLLTASLWGVSFAFQRSCVDVIGPFTYNFVRFLLGGFLLMPLIALRGRKQNNLTSGNKNSGLFNRCKPSLIAGICLFTASSFQQMGIFWTTAGKSGFITGMYVVLVPIFGIFLGRKTGKSTWFGAFLACCGLFLVTGISEMLISGENSANFGDLLTGLGTIIWTVHVLVIDHYSKKCDPIKLSSGQFIVCGLLSGIVSLTGLSSSIGVAGGPEIIESTFSIYNITDAMIPILYSGICSIGIANTLQVIAQKDAPPAHASIFMSMESVFAAIAGFILINEIPANAALVGFALMLCGMLATQWDVIRGNKLK